MMQTVFSMVAMAVMLSLAGSSGSMSDARSFQPVWGMMLAQQVMVVILVLSLPASLAERGGFARIEEEGEGEGDEEGGGEDQARGETSSS